MVRDGSVSMPVTHGVVQGSILGPVLFSLFINDLPSHVPCDKLVIYADDTQFINSCDRGSLESHQAALEGMLDIVQTWFHQNSLKINPAKTELILFGTASTDQTSDFSFSFAGASVKPSPTVKILGVVLDADLRWEAHVSQVVRRCYATLSGLAKLSNKLPNTVKQLIVEALVFPHILYCITVWGGCTKLQKHRVQKVINQAARIVTGSRRRDHVTPLLNQLEWQSVDSLILERDILTIHKLLYRPELSPVNIKRLLAYRSEVSLHRTRAVETGLLELPRVRSERARRFFTYRAPFAWNRAPAEVRERVTVRTCRARLRARPC